MPAGRQSREPKVRQSIVVGMVVGLPYHKAILKDTLMSSRVLQAHSFGMGYFFAHYPGKKIKLLTFEKGGGIKNIVVKIRRQARKYNLAAKRE